MADAGHISQNQLAKITGISAASICNALKCGELIGSGHKQGIDPYHQKSIAWIEKITSNPKSKNARRKKFENIFAEDSIDDNSDTSFLDIDEDFAIQEADQKRRLSPKTEKKRLDKLKKDREQILSRLSDGSDISYLDKLDVDKLKVIAQIKQLDLTLEEKRQRLVPRITVQRVFSRLYLIDSNELKTLGDKVSARIAATCEIENAEQITEIGNIIEKEIFRSLEHIKRTFNDFLKDCRAEIVDG